MHKKRTESQKGRAGIKVTKVLVLRGEAKTWVSFRLCEVRILITTAGHPLTEQKQNS